MPEGNMGWKSILNIERFLLNTKRSKAQHALHLLYLRDFCFFNFFHH